MREAITISLPSDLKSTLDDLSAKAGVSRSDIVRESLRDYIFVQEFRRLRAGMVAKAQAQGIITDEDVFDIVS